MGRQFDWPAIEAIPGRWGGFMLRHEEDGATVADWHRGIIFGRFIVHGGIEGGPFGVSHIKTGLRVVVRLSLPHACLLAQALTSKCGLWADRANGAAISADHAGEREVKALLRPVHERFVAYMNGEVENPA